MTASHVVIIGGGFGGLEAARALADAPVRVTLIDRQNHHLFQPLLYQVATAGLNPSEIAAPIRQVLRDQANVTVILADARAIDVKARKVVLADGELSYDFLIIATGATHSYFGHDEWSDRAPGLKTLEDAVEIRQRFLLAFEAAERETDPAQRAEDLTFVIIGAGATGVEMAGSIAEVARNTLNRDFRHIDTGAARVILVEGVDRVLPAYPPDLSAHAEMELRKRGVEVRTGVRVTALDDHTVTLGSEVIRARTVVWAAGVAASPLVRTLGTAVDRAGRVKVDEHLCVPGHPEVFAIGDVALFDTGDGPLPGVAQVALQGARRAAGNIVNTLRGDPLETFRYQDLGSMATIGRNAAVADVAGSHLKGFIAWLAWLFVHVMALVGFRNKIFVILSWAWSYMTFNRGARLVTRRVPPTLLSGEDSP